MSQKRPRVIGTTPDAILRAEAALRQSLPKSFRSWLLEHNGTALNYVCIFPVLDDRDQRSTWDSIDRRFRSGWTEWLEIHRDAHHDLSVLLPFGDFGTGDYYCFDQSLIGAFGEAPVVLWSHETADTEHRADSFSEFVEGVLAGRIHD